MLLRWVTGRLRWSRGPKLELIRNIRPAVKVRLDRGGERAAGGSWLVVASVRLSPLARGPLRRLVRSSAPRDCRWLTQEAAERCGNKTSRHLALMKPSENRNFFS
jgi:hypothetical protein